MNNFTFLYQNITKSALFKIRIKATTFGKTTQHNVLLNVAATFYKNNNKSERISIEETKK
jgi:hypothetical protein